MHESAHYDKYHQILLDNISEGTQIVKLLFDDQGTPIDYEYLAVNSVYANFLGYDKEEFTGKRATDFLSNIEPEWFIKYEEILKSGRAQRFEMYNNTLGCWFDVLAIPLGELHTFAIIHTNISERKEMEKEIQKYRNRYQELLETNADFIWEMDVNGVYTYCSPQMEKLWGLKPENMIGKVMGAKMTPDGRKKAYEVYRNAVNSSSQIIGFESTTYDEQGNLSYFEINAVPFFDENNNLLGFRGISRDITERKQMEMELQRNREIQGFQLRLNDTLRSLHDAKEIKQAAAQLVGDYLNVDRVLYNEITNSGKTIHIEDNYAKDGLPKVIGDFPICDVGDTIDILRRGEPLMIEDQREIPLITQTVKESIVTLGICASMTVPLIKDGNWLANFAVLQSNPRKWTDRDLAILQFAAEQTWATVERAKAEKALKESEAKYRRLFDTSNDGFWWADRYGYVVEVNEGTARMLGYNQEELIGRFWTDFVDDEWLDEGCKEWEESKKGKSKRYEIKLKKKDGSLIWAKVSRAPLMNEKGEYIGALAAFKDITKQKRAEEELKNSEKKALALVAELEKADKNKNEFISLLSHELRNPLATIQGGIGLLELTGTSEETDKVVKILKRQTEHLSKLVEDLLDVTRISQKKVVLNKEIVVLNTIVRDAITDIKSQFEEKNINLLEQVYKHEIVVDVDPLRITQCIANILRNALKFTEENGIVSISLSAQDNCAIIKVQDDGIGISSEMLPKIFEPFKQDSKYLKTYNNMGLGLGLSIAKDYIELHDGEISASSPGLGKGATFTIRLPII